MKNPFKRLAEWFAPSPSQPTRGTGLHPNDDGLEISPLAGDPSALFIPWSDVRAVTAFKRDRYVVDCICLLLEVSEERGIEINEEMLGWQDLVDKLPRVLPGTEPFHEWFPDVAFPAFATNERVIFRRSVV